MEENWPNLFIVGAPKSGTTSLYNWLKEHPDIYMSSQKETLFFCNIDYEFSGPDAEEINQMVIKSKEEYLKLFKNKQTYKFLGEASTDYLSCENSAKNIKSKSPNAKIIMLLRNPVDRAFSEHMHLVRDGLEELTFKESLAAEEERIKNNWNTLFKHKRRGLYSKDVKNYLDFFGKKNVKIYLYEELKNTPKELINDIFDFLNLKKINIKTNSIYNKSGEVKNKSIEKLVRGKFIPNYIKKAIKFILGKDLISKLRLNIQNFNLRKRTMSKVAREELEDYFREDIKELEKILKKDLSNWY